MLHMDTTWKVTDLEVLLSFVESARTRLCFLPSQSSMTFGSIKPLSWVATQTLPALCCHFLAVNNRPTLPQDALTMSLSWQLNQSSKSRCTAGVVLLGTEAGTKAVWLAWKSTKCAVLEHSCMAWTMGELPPPPLTCHSHT